MKNASIFPLLIILLGIWSSSCEQEIASIRLTSRERIHIDTIAKRKIDSLILVMDSACLSKYWTMRDAALDSILKVRKEEELKIRSRIPKQ
ncbi:MAG: hypothetical protein MI974_03585 [Chitinophagales bacterium]|nr:hypothetical protein [Chitinophagales bacterium]